MAINDRKEREKAELKSLIIKGASEVFLEEGYEKTSIRKIAERIEYSPATIYLYYKDKNDILLELHNEAFQHFHQSLLTVASIEDPFDRLAELGRAYIRFGLENPSRYELMFILVAPMEALECREEIWNDGANSLQLCADLVQECINKGYFRANLDVQATSVLLWSTVHGIVSLHLHNRFKILPPDDCEDIINRSYDLLVRMMRSSL